VYTQMGRPENISKIIDEVEETLFPAIHYARLIKHRNLENQIQVSTKAREYEDVQTKINELKALGKSVDINTIADVISKGDPSKEAYKTGYDHLDSVLRFENTDLFVLAGKSSVGKSILGMQIIANMARVIPVGMISFEMAEFKLVKRLSYSHSANQLSAINDTLCLSNPSPFNLATVRKTIKEMKAKKGVKVVLIDYLQLMSETP
jgi:replicative DNA helicase